MNRNPTSLFNVSWFFCLYYLKVMCTDDLLIFPQIVNGLRYFGVGCKVTRSIYKFPDTYWIITKFVFLDKLEIWSTVSCLCGCVCAGPNFPKIRSMVRFKELLYGEVYLRSKQWILDLLPRGNGLCCRPLITSHSTEKRKLLINLLRHDPTG